MNKDIKYALLFTGGVAVGFGICGYKTIKYALNDEYIRKALAKKISDRIDKKLYGEPKSKNRSRSYYYYQVTDELLFDTRKDAEEAVGNLCEIIDMYGCVSVADLYDLVDLPAPYTSNKYGWTGVKDFEIMMDANRRGYVLKVPKAISIK